MIGGPPHKSFQADYHCTFIVNTTKKDFLNVLKFIKL